MRGACTDAVTMRDHDRFAALFTEDGAWRMPHCTLTWEPGTAAVRVPVGVIAADTLLAAERLARDAENHD